MNEQERRRAWVDKVIAAYGDSWVAGELGFSAAECERWLATGGITETDIMLLEIRLEELGWADHTLCE